MASGEGRGEENPLHSVSGMLSAKDPGSAKDLLKALFFQRFELESSTATLRPHQVARGVPCNMSLFLLVLCFVFLSIAYIFVSRVWLHPLSRIPGSFIAAVSSSSYEFYWNLLKKGSLLWEIDRLHRLHGPVIRIGTNEVHVNDPEVYPVLFKVGSKYLKDAKFYDTMVGLPTGSIGLVDPEKHRARRDILLSFFHEKRMEYIAPMIINKVEVLLRRLESGSPVNLNAAFKAFTMDITSNLIFGVDFGVLETPGFHHAHIAGLKAVVQGIWIPRILPAVSALLMALPFRYRKHFLPKTVAELISDCRRLVDANLVEYGTSSPKHPHLPSVVGRLLTPTKKRSDTVPSVEELNEEVLTLMIAGTDTTANSFIIGTYLISSSIAVSQRLEAELLQAFPSSQSKISYETAKQLPYLTAVIKEVLRVANPLPGRLPRVVPEGGVVIHGHYIPQGTVISMSAYLLHRLPANFGADAASFRPERWLEATESDKLRMEKYFATFSKGSRQCAGLHLAWCELYIFYATLYRGFQVRLEPGSEDEVKWRDHMLMYFPGDGLKARITRKEA